MPIGNNSDFEDIDSDGISFFSYRGTGYVVTFGKLATNGFPIMKMFKFGCDSLVPVQTWNASILHIAFWNQNKTAWMAFQVGERVCLRVGRVSPPGIQIASIEKNGKHS